MQYLERDLFLHHHLAKVDQPVTHTAQSGINAAVGNRGNLFKAHIAVVTQDDHLALVFGQQVQHILYAAVALALQALFTAIGGAIGSSISAAIWTNTLLGQLRKNLPASALGNINDIYGSLDTQLSYPIGSPVRDAIIKSYGVTEKYQCIAATASLIILLVGVCMFRNIRVKDFKKPKGAKIV